MAKQSYRFMQNRQCEYFPCHQGIAEEEFNCLFCYCPLYTLGRKCGGNCHYTAQGLKSCAGCTFPHIAKNYERIIARYEEIAAVAARTDEEDNDTLAEK